MTPFNYIMSQATKKTFNIFDFKNYFKERRDIIDELIKIYETRADKRVNAAYIPLTTLQCLLQYTYLN